MDPPLILPKGVIKNSEGISGSIERMARQPLDLADIARFWKVYTTTRRRLLDPTAERLENYWWRIWGSRARELEASTIAGMFAFISDGNSFVPLTSTANRDEGTPPTDDHFGLDYLRALPGNRPSPSKRNTTPKISVVPPPSILKGSDSKNKGRGISASGPRPTARFISPHESENENSPVSPNAHVVVQPPTPTAQDPKPEKKTIATSGKKRSVFVASTGRIKRPSTTRRQGSHSSTDSNTKGGEIPASTSGKTQPQAFEPVRERGKQRADSQSQENSTSSSGRSGHRQSPVRTRHSKIEDTPTRKPTSRRRSSTEMTCESVDDAQPGPSTSRLRPTEYSQDAPEEPTIEDLEEIETQSLLLAEANARVQGQARQPIQTSLPLQQQEVSDHNHNSESNGALGPARAGRLAQTRNKSAPILAPTFADANGQLDLGNGRRAPSRTKKQDKGKGRGADEAAPDDMFSKRPVQPLASTAIPDSTGGLSRSKSQLTLLLQKDRAKNAEQAADHSSKAQ